MTAQWHLEPLPFSALAEFFPKWDADARVAAYAMVGGIPAYFNWFDPDLDLIDNIRQTILSPGSMFLAEPAFLLYDEVREPNSYLSILKAIGGGAHLNGDRRTGVHSQHQCDLLLQILSRNCAWSNAGCQ